MGMKRETLLTAIMVAQQEMAIHFHAVTDPVGHGVGGWGLGNYGLHLAIKK